MKKIFFLLSFVFSLCTSSVIALEPILLVTGDWPPFTGRDLPGKGFISEVITQVFDSMNVPYRIEFYPWDRCAAYVKSGEAFAAFPYAKTAQREIFADFSHLLYRTDSNFFYLNKRFPTPPNYTELNELNQYKVGVGRGYFFIDTFKSAGLNFTIANTEEELISKLYHGRLDLIPLNQLVGLYLIQKLYPNESQHFNYIQKPVRTADSDSDLHLMISKTYPNATTLKEQFNTALDAIQQQGGYQAILEKHKLVQH